MVNRDYKSFHCIVRIISLILGKIFRNLKPIVGFTMDSTIKEKRKPQSIPIPKSKTQYIDSMDER